MLDRDVQSNLTLRYMVAAIGLSAITIFAIVVVTAVRPEHDNSGIITSILAVSGATYPGLATFIRSQANSEELIRAKRIADAKAEQVRQALVEANRKIEETNAHKEAHLARQDEQLESVKSSVQEIVKKTDGLIDEIKEKAHREGHESGEKAALQKLGIEPKRITD